LNSSLSGIRSSMAIARGPRAWRWPGPHYSRTTVQFFVRPFANGKITGSEVWPISAAGWAYPVWSRAESQLRQLLYLTSEGRLEGLRSAFQVIQSTARLPQSAIS
jgi:hypothetical protein